MGFINLAEKTISAKLVYYGVGMGGKTTSLQAVHAVLCPSDDDVQLVSINTEDESTLLFDFLPIDLGQVEGFKIRIQGFTVPGQPKYRQMRKYVLQGADAVVFVVDSQTSRLEENEQSFESLFDNLRSNGLDPESMPILLQYNKRDLDDILEESELDEHFKWRKGVPAFPSVAHESCGVYETFVEAASMIVDAKVRLYGLGRGSVSPEIVAKGARDKLWEFHDASRAADPKSSDGSLAVTVVRDAAAGGDINGEALFSDEELDQQLLLPLAEEPVEVAAEEHSEQLLDEVIQTNVELARHFGELDRYKTVLERRHRELVQIAQNTVHDLKRPLSVIRLMLTSTSRGLFGDVPDKVREGIDNGMLAVSQMERLIADLLDSSRLDYDGVKLDFQEIDMSLLIGDLLRGMRYEVEDGDVVLCVEPLPRILGDSWALNKAFANLIGNALQYRHPDRRPTLRICARREEDRHVFLIQDNGIGIPEADLPRLFRRFERGTNTAGVSGTGLGLHIVREVVLGHGGSLWVESIEGEGSTFSIALPFEPIMPPHDAIMADA